MSDQNSVNGRKASFLDLHRYSHENDIKFRGPLSYGGMQILGWLCIVLTVVTAMLRMGSKVSPDLESKFKTLIEILEYVGPMSLPFLLLANFAKILNNEEGYVSQLLRNFVAMAGIYVAFWLFYDHYFKGSIAVFATNTADTGKALDMIINSIAPNKFIAFNFFVDMFLCTLLMFFLNYKPRKLFTGRAVIIFRLFAILPIAYELGCMVLKEKIIRGEIMLPVMAFPLLTVKPIMTFVEFMVMAIFIKTRELLYCRHGNTHEEYKAFLQTNRNSLHFAIFTSISMLALGLFDLFYTILLVDSEAVGLVATNPEDVAKYYKLIYRYLAIGMGKGVYMAFIAPIVLLFSYTRHPKFKKYLLLIPAAGVVLIVFILVQSGYQLIHVTKVTKIDILGFAKDISEFLRMLHAQ